ncbi:hypothetical protein Q0M94_20830 (plasmid) [Deinococcus radiomollis]|uniref:hypothetical protein n=1 Tax=Deinococcus radiomollis TaxID=468916 RepID=UPI0038918B59
MLLRPTDKMHFVTTRTLRNVAEYLAYLLLASLLCGIGVGVLHVGLPTLTVCATFLLGVLLMCVLTWRRFAQEWEWRKTLNIRRTKLTPLLSSSSHVQGKCFLNTDSVVAIARRQ